MTIITIQIILTVCSILLPPIFIVLVCRENKNMKYSISLSSFLINNSIYLHLYSHQVITFSLFIFKWFFAVFFGRQSQLSFIFHKQSHCDRDMTFHYYIQSTKFSVFSISLKCLNFYPIKKMKIWTIKVYSSPFAILEFLLYNKYCKLYSQNYMVQYVCFSIQASLAFWMFRVKSILWSQTIIRFNKLRKRGVILSVNLKKNWEDVILTWL